MPPPDLDTVVLADLLARAGRGESSARDELLSRAQNRLERLASKMLRDYPSVRRWEDTADVLQEALVRLVRALGAVTPTTTREFFGLSAEQIRRCLLDLARHYHGPLGLGRNHHSSDSKPAAELVEQRDADPGDLEHWTRLHVAVERLPAEEREVFMLVFYHGWTQPRIAELLGVDERTVRRRWRAAGRILHDALGGSAPEPGE